MICLKGIKNIVFDFGGVLVDLNQQACMDAFAALGIPQVSEYMSLYGHNGPFGDIEKGSINVDDFRNQIRTLFKVPVTDEQIDNAWNAFLLNIPEKKMHMVHELAKKYRVFLLSNTNPIHIQKLQNFENAGYPVKECFEKLYLSFEIGLIKPERAIFDYMVKDAGIKPEETLFIDDGPANCRTASELGMKTYQPQPFEDFTGELLQPESCVATLGFFDGVHRGHQFLIEEMKRIANEKDLPSMVISFWPHPRTVLHTNFCPQLLTDKSEKEERIIGTGVDYVRTLTFDFWLAGLTARQFMDEILKQELHVKVLVIGFDHRFGNSRSDDFKDYQRYGEKLGIEVVQAKPYMFSGKLAVSSSLIRRYLLSGKIEEANALLGYNYCLKGKVVGGHQIGRSMGFPTANIVPNDLGKLVPAFGVYAVWVNVGEMRYKGMMDIGRRPTLHAGSVTSLEVHLLDFEGDLYNKEISIEFVQLFRQEKSFPDLDALAVQLGKDKVYVEKFLTK
jgi:riboflavin kinase/FMN adenylyltransferase